MALEITAPPYWSAKNSAIVSLFRGGDIQFLCGDPLSTVLLESPDRFQILGTADIAPLTHNRKQAQ